MKILLSLLVLLAPLARSAEMIPVPPLESCFLCSSLPSNTLYWQGKDARAVLLFIPGGEGVIGLKPLQNDHRYPLFQTLKRLADPNLTSGKFDVVLLDSPAALMPSIPARGTTDHMIRIESVVRHYKAKTGLPVWLMGHSNGGLSMTEFLKYARKHNKMDLIGAMVPSAIRSESRFDGPIGFPMLFMHHIKDGCGSTLLADSKRNYEKVKLVTTAPIEFVEIQSGQAEAGNSCNSGFHMYAGAGEEVVRHLDEFMSRIHK